MKLLAVIDTLGFGGAERHLLSLCLELKQLGIDCEVAVLGSPYDLISELRDGGIPVHPIEARHRWLVPESAYKLRRLCLFGRFDAVWGHLYFGNLNAALAGAAACRPVVWTIQTANYRNPPTGWWPRVRMRIEQEAGRRLADRIVAASHSLAHDYETALGWDRLTVIHNCVPVKHLPARLDPEARRLLREKMGIGEEACILVPARLVAQKGHSILLRALRLMADADGKAPLALFAGEGPLGPSLMAEARALGLGERVRLMEPMPQERLFPLMQACDAVVLPSLREPFGIAAAEAMALACPVVASAVDGLVELTSGGTAALLVPPGEPEPLASAIRAVLTDDALRARLRAAGPKRIHEAFDASVLATRWAELFKGIG